MKYLHILCEGHCERDFVNNHLNGYLIENCNIPYVSTSLITTNQDLKIKGGNTDYLKIRRDICNLLQEPYRVVTTFIDFYALPKNFPNYNECIKKYSDKYQIKQCLENAIFDDIKRACNSNPERFIPYIQLHEFEALIFGDIQNIKSYQNKELDPKKAKKLLQDFDNNPELINSINPPSKLVYEILNLKNSPGKSIVANALMRCISIDNIMNNCKGFREWINKICNTICN